MKQHETTPLVPISRGSGSWLYDFDGHRYLDCPTRDDMEMLASRTPEIVACA